MTLFAETNPSTGSKAFRSISLRDAPVLGLPRERESRFKALAGVGITVIAHERCGFEIHGMTAMDKAHRGFPIDDLRITTNISEEGHLEKEGWTKLVPKLKRYGLASYFLWTHTMAVSPMLASRRRSHKGYP